MNFLKKYLTFHICALFGYMIPIIGLYTTKSLEDLNTRISVFTYPNSKALGIFCDIAIYFWGLFILIFPTEFIIHKLSQKFFNKDLSLDIQNKYYNMFFAIGYYILVIILFPGTLFISFCLLLLLFNLL